MITIGRAIVWGAVVVLGVGCGGPEKEGRPALPPPPPPSEPEEAALDGPPPPPATETEPVESEPEPAAQTPPPEPVFEEGMSVQQAMDAVPREWDFVGIDTEALAKPLQEPEAFAACKLKPQQRFKVHVAVWDGRAVGVDVESKNNALAECVGNAIRQMEWRDKVKSLNTVQYSY